MIPVVVQRSVVLLAVAVLSASCSIDSVSPEERWQDTYNQAFVLQSNKKWDKAESSYSSALTLARKIDPKGKRVADTLLGLGEIAVKRNDYSHAIEYLGEARAIYQKLWNPDQGGVNNRDNAIYLAKIMMNYSAALAGQKKLKEAKTTIATARHIAEVAPAPDYVTHDIMALQADIAKALGEGDEARLISKGASVFDTPVDGKKSDETRDMSWQDLIAEGDSAVAALNFDNANAMYEKAKKRLERDNLGGFALGRLYLSMGTLYDARKEYDKATRTLMKAVRILRINEEMPKTSMGKYYTSEAMEKLAAVYSHNNNLEQAQELFRQCLEIEHRLQKKDGAKLRERKLMQALEDVYKKQGRYAEARKIVLDKMAIELPYYGPKSKKIGCDYQELANLSALMGKDAEACEYFDKAVKNLEKVADLNPRYKLEVYDSYATSLEKLGKTAEAQVIRRKADDLETGIVNDLSR